MQSSEAPVSHDWQPQPLRSPEKLVARCHDILLDAICDGGLPAGARVTQESLAESLAVSRQPISHALVLLKRQGFLRDAPGRGLEVAPVDPDHLRSVFEVRAALDSLAAANAARRATRGGKDVRRSLGEMDGVLAEGKAAARASDFKALVRLDMAFHELLAGMSGNAVMLDIARQQWAHVRRGVAVALQDRAFHLRCWKEHAAIASAIRAGEADTAGRLARDHCELAGAETWRRLRMIAEQSAA
jgi:DNA-binding GntR family transcriptional regulator